MPFPIVGAQLQKEIISENAPDKLDKVNDLSSLANMVEQMRSENPESDISNLVTEEIIIENALAYNGSKVVSDNKIQQDKLLNMLQSCKKIYDNNNSIYSDEQIQQIRIDCKNYGYQLIDNQASSVLTGYLQL